MAYSNPSDPLVCQVAGPAQQASLGIAVPDFAGDPDDRLDQGSPLGAGYRMGGGEDLDGPGFISIACSIARRVAAAGLLRGTGGFDLLHQRGLIVFQLDEGVCLGLCDRLEGLLLAVQRIEGDGAMREREFAQQLLGGGDLVGFLVDIEMRQDQAGLGIEGVQQLSRFAVPEMVETAPERLAIQRRCAAKGHSHRPEDPSHAGGKPVRRPSDPGSVGWYEWRYGWVRASSTDRRQRSAARGSRQ